jgi:hypothetical protein
MVIMWQRDYIMYKYIYLDIVCGLRCVKETLILSVSYIVYHGYFIMYISDKIALIYIQNI